MVHDFHNSVAVVGLGYVGLPLALLAEQKGFTVTGVEASAEKLSELKDGVSSIDDSIVTDNLSGSSVYFTDDITSVSGCGIVIICVPTPVDKDKNPDLSLVKKAAEAAAQSMKPGSLLVIESTINPGVCDEVVIPIIESATDHVVGKSIHIAHCPERINPGDPKWNVGNINRVLGASDAVGLEIAFKFYGRLVDADIMRMGSIKEAEAVKVVENSFRDVNIAFVNELAMSFKKLGINVNNVIDGAATKPFAFMAHYPGIGVGGHCIPVDPYYLIEYARSNGFEHRFLKLARDINESMPVYSVDLLEQALIERTKQTLDKVTVCVLGLSYKPNVGDDRESPAHSVIHTLKTRGATVTTFDPYFPKESSAESLDDALASADAVILVTAHKELQSIDPAKLGRVEVFLDGRNVMREKFKDHANRITYIGLSS